MVMDSPISKDKPNAKDWLLDTALLETTNLEIPASLMLHYIASLALEMRDGDQPCKQLLMAVKVPMTTTAASCMQCQLMDSPFSKDLSVIDWLHPTVLLMMLNGMLIVNHRLSHIAMVPSKMLTLVICSKMPSMIAKVMMTTGAVSMASLMVIHSPCSNHLKDATTSTNISIKTTQRLLMNLEKKPTWPSATR